MRTALCVLLLLTLACSVFSRPPEPAGLSRILDTGELRVGMSGEQPPLNMTARNGEIIGLEVALVRVLAKAMRVEARLVRLPFGELLDALEQGEIDMVMSGMTITPARSRRATFVGPYYTSGKTLLARSPRVAAATDPSEIDSPDLRLVALAGSTSEEFARESLPASKLTTEVRLQDAVARLLTGQVDALVADRETCDFAALRHAGAGLHVSPTPFTLEPLGIAVRPEETRFARLLETYLDALRESGGLEKATAVWFESSAWVQDLR